MSKTPYIAVHRLNSKVLPGAFVTFEDDEAAELLKVGAIREITEVEANVYAETQKADATPAKKPAAKKTTAKKPAQKAGEEKATSEAPKTDEAGDSNDDALV